MDLNTILWALMVFYVKELSYSIAHDFEFSFPEDYDTRAEEENSCFTNSGSQGQCVSYMKCTTIPRVTISSIRPKICRWEGADAIICCPLQNPSIPAAPVSPLSEACTDMPQRSSNHRIRRDDFFAFVVGGIDARVSQWPFMAALFTKTDRTRKNPFCGGALIGPDVVLTAAHCFISDPSDTTYVVLLGATNLIKGDEGVIVISRDVSKLIVHEDYRYPVTYHDIAIMKLQRRVLFTGSVKPICLPYDAMSRQDFVGQTANIIGWGHLESGGPSAKTLQFAEVPIITNSDCQNIYRNLDFAATLPNGILNNIICAGSKTSKQDACQGDSGGPLVIKDPRGNKAILVGVVSAGFECGRRVPGLYTRVTQYLKWISENSR